METFPLSDYKDFIETNMENASNIVTSFNPPPIPARNFDWNAYVEGYEPGDPLGYGSTEEEAIQNLKDML